MSGQRWSSDLAFSLSAVGAAVGLGSIWRFPYLAGAGGGFAFILVFVIACLVFGAPVLVGEIVIGRWSRRSPPQAAGRIAEQFGYSRLWNAVGWTGSIAGFLIIAYYTMIAGWVLAYTWFFLSGNYARGGAAAATGKFHAFIADSRAVSLWQLGFFALVALISARGVNRGVEWANRWRAPALLTILLALVAYSLATGDVARGLTFAFAPDLSRLSPAIVLGAVGQALFALGVSAGLAIALRGLHARGGVRRTRRIGRHRLDICGIAAGHRGHFPAGVPLRAECRRGPSTGFRGSSPVAFAEMPAGRVIGTLFFALLILAAFTPSAVCWSPGSRGWWNAAECGAPLRRASARARVGWWGRERCCRTDDGPIGTH